MAVKQNNTESNDGQSAASNKGAAPKAKLSSVTNINGVFNNANASNDGGGGKGSAGESASGGSTNQMNVDQMLSGPLTHSIIAENPFDIKDLLRLIQTIEQRDPSMCYTAHETFNLYRNIIILLSRTRYRNDPEDLKSFKEDIYKVGAFLSKSNEKHYLVFCMRTVYELIAQSVYEDPSCAVAIVLHLFSPELIIESVNSLLEQNIPDSTIRRTIGLLCEWMCICNFCQNLNLWIMALLSCLHDQEKYMLLDEIALDNIEKLFLLLILPALRPKVAPIVFHMLSTINYTPEIFHKIIPKIPGVIRYLKQQSFSIDEFGAESRGYMQKTIDVTNALMMRYFEYDELYVPLKAALLMYEPSFDYVNLARAMHENSLPPGRRNPRVGLVNLGNTCYMNSVLQALAMTTDFSSHLLLVETNSPLIIKVQQQIALMHHSMRCELTPLRVLNSTRPSSFTPGQQQDSSEFLGYFLDLLHEQEINTTKQKQGTRALTMSDSETTASDVIPYNSYQRSRCNNNGGGSNSSQMHTSSATVSGSVALTSSPSASPTKAPSNEEPMPKNPPTTIDKTFAGKLATTHKCLNCGWESCKEDSFRELQLSFPDEKDECSASNYSVQDLIEYYCTPEKMVGDNQYYCPSCKKNCDAERRIGITQAPRNLILTLKQFKYDQKYHFRTKLLHKVFHDESVTVKLCSQKTLQELSTVHYDLYAGVVHAGYSMDSGHYFTFAADQSKKWYKFNDNLVTLSQPDEMHNLTSPNTPYILFYQMCGRSNESSNLGSKHTMITTQLTQPLTLEELPRTLRDFVIHDNRLYSDELKMQRIERNAKQNNDRNYGIITRNGYNKDGRDEDDDLPPTGGCGTNDMSMNMNRFVY